ncbi:MAG: LuxR C-terminal-related transcriptional regulator [Bacteroidales bacterium]
MGEKKKIKFPAIRLSIFGKLLVGIVAVQILVFIISIVSLTSINNLERGSNEIFKESVVHYNIHSLKIKLSQLVMPVNDYLIHGNKIEVENYHRLREEVSNQLRICYQVIKDQRHIAAINDFEKNFKEILSLAEKIFAIEVPIHNFEAAVMMERMDLIADRTIEMIDESMVISLLEIEGNIEFNQSTNTRAHRIIIFVALITVLSLLIGGYFYVREITVPIKHLLTATTKISMGDFSTKAPMKSKTGDELEEFVTSFNNMIGSLEKITVSKDYFHNILKRMVDSLIITGVQGKIRVVNQSCLELLGYEEEELIGQPLDLVVKINDELKNKSNILNTYYSREGRSIPVLFSNSVMYDSKDNYCGMICLACNVTKDQKQDILYTGNTDQGNKKNIRAIGEVPLTSRELEIMKLIAEGNSNQDIATKLFISVRTVETHRRNLMQKIHSKSVIDLVHYAVQNGII